MQTNEPQCRLWEFIEELIKLKIHEIPNCSFVYMTKSKNKSVNGILNIYSHIFGQYFNKVEIGFEIFIRRLCQVKIKP